MCSTYRYSVLQRIVPLHTNVQYLPIQRAAENSKVQLWKILKCEENKKKISVCIIRLISKWTSTALLKLFSECFVLITFLARTIFFCAINNAFDFTFRRRRERRTVDKETAADHTAVQ